MINRLETELKLQGFSDQTIKAYILHNKKFLEYINKLPLEVEEEDVKKYMAHLISERNQKPASVSLVLSALKFFYKNIIGKEVIKNLKAPKAEKKLPIVLTKKEVLKLLNRIKNKKHRLIIELMYSSGLRVSECVSLKKNDIDFNEKIITVRAGKGRKDRITILSNTTAKHIKQNLEEKSEHPFLFPSGEGHVSTKLAQKIIKQAAEKANINKRVFCHALRSSFATQLLENGVDLRTIQTLLGHAHLATTEIYTKVSTEKIKKVKSPFD